jgi:uncharacterized protein with NAD-binding domain and iron-sulfur cluster
MRERVIVLGGGVAGLSAAHELVERGFDVTVFEVKSIPGGKARSVPVPYSGLPRNVGTVYQGRLRGNRRRDLPGEHGFRFFPKFYKHIIDTMHRIPYETGVVAENLVETSRVSWAMFDQPAFETVPRFPRSLSDLLVLLGDAEDIFTGRLGITPDEKALFATRTWQLMTSCHERRMDEYERIGWWQFVGAEGRSKAYQRFFGIGFTRQLVAARAELASTKTIGEVWTAMILGALDPGVGLDRVLNGPTSEVWINPWLEYLRAAGVTYYLNSAVRSIRVRAGRIASVTVEQDGRNIEVQGDYYVAALPVEVMAPLVSQQMMSVDPGLANLVPLSHATQWMNGCQYFLNEDLPLTPGHVIYVDSPWALTSISQKQFWQDVDLSNYGNGKVRGIISVDISEWNEPGLLGKRAVECTRDEIKRDVWEQLKRSLNSGGRSLLRDEYVVDWFLDPDIDPAAGRNLEPLLVNYVDTWRLRPGAVTNIPNLFLASDYVQTDTDLATMEGANEAARRAVNGILAASGRTADACQLWELHEPAVLQPWRAHDRARYARGLPWDDTLVSAAIKGLAAVQNIAPTLTNRLGDAQALPDTLRSLMAIVSGSMSGQELLKSIDVEKVVGQLDYLYPLLYPVIARYLDRLTASVPTNPATGSDYPRTPGRVRFESW